MIETPPCSVNLMALPARLNSTWRSRAASPTTSRRQPLVDEAADFEPFACARGPSSSAASSTKAASANGRAARSMRPASILEKSRISSISDKQRVARGLHRLDIGRLLGGERRVGEQVRHAEDAVERRADFVRHHGEKVGFGAIGGLRLVARLCQRALGVGAVGDVAADALHFAAGVAAHGHLAPGDPARARGGRDFLVVNARAVRQQAGLALLSAASANAVPKSSARSRPASAQKASLA